MPPVSHRRLRPGASTFVVCTAVALLIASLSLDAQKGKNTTIPQVVEFINAGISDDGRGPYYDGEGGVSAYRVCCAGTANSLAFHTAANKVPAPRSLTYNLTNAIQGNPLGVLTVVTNRVFIYDLSNMAIGEEKYVRASFHQIINRVEYVLRFGQTAGDGSSPLLATRVTDGQFHVRTAGQGTLARYLRGNGPGEVLLGIYNVPMELVLTNK